MPAHHSPSDRLRSLFRRRKCWMLQELAQSLGYALVSVRRFLKEIGYFRSYTHNGKWYTLPEFPRFNREGLWRHKDIGFSKHGGLIATIDHLIQRSPAGLSTSELTQILQHPCPAVLIQLHNAGHLDRLRLGGQFRYLALEPKINQRQRRQAALLQGPAAGAALTTQTALWVLVEHIKDPTLSFERIAARLRKQRQLSLTAESIEQFFGEHDLKKTSGASM
jgi:hypothetical protein